MRRRFRIGAVAVVLTFGAVSPAQETERPAFTYDDELACLAFSPDGRSLAAGCPRGEPHVLVFDVESGARRARFETAHHTFACGFDEDGKRVFATSLGGMDRAQVWDVSSRKPAGSFAIPYEGSFYACRAAMSPNGELLATAGLSDGIVRIWDTRTGKTVHELAGHVGEVWCLRFSRDGRRLASGGRDGSARLWDLKQGTPLLRVDLKEEPVVDVVLHRDGAHLVTAGGHGSVAVWRLADGERACTVRIEGVPKESVFNMFEPLPAALSADGTVCVAATPRGLVRVPTDGEGEPLLLPTDRPFPFAVSHDGLRIAAPVPGAESPVNRIHVWAIAAIEIRSVCRPTEEPPDAEAGADGDGARRAGEGDERPR